MFILILLFFKDNLRLCLSKSHQLGQGQLVDFYILIHTIPILKKYWKNIHIIIINIKNHVLQESYLNLNNITYSTLL